MSIKIENVEVVGWSPTIRGMRNPKNSWELNDSAPCMYSENNVEHCVDCVYIEKCKCEEDDMYKNYIIGPNDHKLMMSLAKGGPVHAKYRRMIAVYLDITAPLYWWKEFDTYKVGTVANSCSTMHKIPDKEFTLNDFSCEHLLNMLNHIYDEREVPTIDMSPYNDNSIIFTPLGLLEQNIKMLNICREQYLIACKTEEETGIPAKDIWWQMIQLLPSSYNQKRTIMLNYEVLHNMYFSRKNHKLDEWRELCKWIESLPYSEIITTKSKMED